MVWPGALLPGHDADCDRMFKAEGTRGSILALTTMSDGSAVRA